MSSVVPVHQTIELNEFAKVLSAAIGVTPGTPVASTLQEILSLALQGGYTVLLSVMPEVLAAISAYSPALGVVSAELLPALEAILAKLLTPATPTPAPVVPVVPTPAA